MIFERFLKVGSATMLARQLNAEGVTTRSGKPIDKGVLYKLLNNRVYVGEASFYYCSCTASCLCHKLAAAGT